MINLGQPNQFIVLEKNKDMKKILLLLQVALCNNLLTAQTTGKIDYEEKVKLEIKLDDADEKMLADIPKEHTSQKELYFTPEVSLYRNGEAAKAKPTTVNEETEGGPRMIIRMDQSDDKVYCDLKSKQRLEQRDFMSRTFLVESDLNSMQWKLTGNQKMILNYPCQEAVLQDTSKKVVAWFTPAIPVSTGPNGYANLPGIILSVDVDNGKRTIVATKSDLKEFDQSILKKPTEGKKMTKEAFNKMMDEKRKEMKQENGGKGDVIIKVRH